MSCQVYKSTPQNCPPADHPADKELACSVKRFVQVSATDLARCMYVCVGGGSKHRGCMRGHSFMRLR